MFRSAIPSYRRIARIGPLYIYKGEWSHCTSHDSTTEYLISLRDTGIWYTALNEDDYGEQDELISKTYLWLLEEGLDATKHKHHVSVITSDANRTLNVVTIKLRKELHIASPATFSRTDSLWWRRE